MCREKKQGKESTSYEDGIKPSMIEIKLDISAQYISYNQPAKTPHRKINCRLEFIVGYERDESSECQYQGI